MLKINWNHAFEITIKEEIIYAESTTPAHGTRYENHNSRTFKSKFFTNLKIDLLNMSLNKNFKKANIVHTLLNFMKSKILCFRRIFFNFMKSSMPFFASTFKRIIKAFCGDFL